MRDAGRNRVLEAARQACEQGWVDDTPLDEYGKECVTAFAHWLGALVGPEPMTRIVWADHLDEAREALREAHSELGVLGADLQEIDDGIRNHPTALLNGEIMERIESILAKLDEETT